MVSCWWAGWLCSLGLARSGCRWLYICCYSRLLTCTCSPSLSPHHKCTKQAAAADLSDANADVCVLCGHGGNLLCCDACPAAYHVRCVGETSRAMGSTEWLCPECRVGGRGERGQRAGGRGGWAGCRSPVLLFLLRCAAAVGGAVVNPTAEEGGALGKP